MDEAEIVKTIKHIIGNPSGRCYAASEALYYILGGKAAGYTPVRGPGHWWLRRPDGTILDVTEDQFIPGWYPYKKGKDCGFLTKEPSKIAQEILNVYYTC